MSKMDLTGPLWRKFVVFIKILLTQFLFWQRWRKFGIVTLKRLEYEDFSTIIKLPKCMLLEADHINFKIF